ncbi:MAG: LuxR C-terminal-related transcriptional regulator [Nitrospira sp.]
MVQLLAEGYAGEDIAGPAKVSALTVEFHKEQTMEQLNLQATVEVARYTLWG